LQTPQLTCCHWPEDDDKMTGKISEIVVAMDGSAYSLTAARWGAELAKADGAELVLLHVVESRIMQSPLVMDISGMLGAAPLEQISAQLHEMMEERGRNVLAAGEEVAAACGVSATVRLLQGVCAEAICTACDNANLLVLGRRGQHALHGRHLLGSDGERALRHVNCSVLVVAETFEPPQRIVTGVNDSGPARSAIAWTEYLHGAFPDSEICPVHVTEATDDNAFADTQVASTSVRCIPGNPESELLRICAEEPLTTLGVIGATGHTRTLKELILGTLSFHVLHQLKGPALLAR
jgi:nucleotide-binding universal stress UspA family protein